MSKISLYSIYSHLGMYGLLNWVSDEQYLKIQYFLKMHKRLKLNSPETFNEKIQWLKLNDRKHVYSELVDKYLVRKHIGKALGEEYLIPLLEVWHEPDDINIDNLPKQFVLKCNHDSGGVVVCKDKGKLNIKKTKSILKRRFNRDYSWGNREWPYKGVRRLVLAEKYVEDYEDAGRLTDYKFYCFNGKAHCVLACVDRTPTNAKYIFFDRNWERLNYTFLTEDEKRTKIPRPMSLEKMFDISERIARYVNCPFLRVDLFESGGKVFFGEVTFYPHSGMDKTLLPETDLLFGKMIRL